MNLSEASKMRFNGVDVKMVKLNGNIVYRKEEEDPLLIAQYTASESGVVPKFNAGFTGYNVSETIVDGVYSVTIRTNTADNTPTSISFNGMSNLLTVIYLKTVKVTNMAYMFSGCNALTLLDASGWDTSNVTSMAGMLLYCYALTSLDVSGWDTSKVTNMTGMFSNCNSLTSLDVSGWDTSEVTNMASMFFNCNALTSLDVSGWGTSNVTSMTYMFYNCNALTSLDVSGWDTSEVTSMNNMFQGSDALTSLDVSGWDTSKVTNMAGMFSNCNALTSLDSMMNISTDLSLPSSLNEESILDVIDNLASVSSRKTLKISNVQLSWVPEDKIIEANNKGWTISA
jgi:surface protein